MPRVGHRPQVRQEPEPVRQVRLDLLRRQHARPRGGQLDRQRQAVQRPADPGHHLHRRRPGTRPGQRAARQEQPHRRHAGQGPGIRLFRRHGQRRHREDGLAPNAQRLPAGRQHPQPRGAAQQRRRQRGARAEQVLAVIQDEQQLGRMQPVAQRLDHRHLAGLPDPQRLHHLGRHQLRIGDARQVSQPRPVTETLCRGCGRGEFDRQPRLAGAARPGQGDQPGLAEQAVQRGQVPLPPHETGQPGRQIVLLAARRRGRDLLPQHRPLELAQLLARLDAQLLGQHRPGPAVRGQRIALPPAPVQREHQKPPQPLAERIPGHQARQLPGNLRRRPQLDIGLEPALHRHQPELLQPGALPGQSRHIGHVRKRAAPPQPQRPPEPGGRGRRLTVLQRLPARPGQPLEPGRVQLIRSRRQGVTAAPRDQRRIRARQRAQPGQMRSQRPGRTRRRRGPPQILGQPLRRNHPSPRHQQQREHRAPPRAAQRKLPAIPDRLHRPENAELERPASRPRKLITSHASIVSHPNPP